MAEEQVPEGLTADYVNSEVREAMVALQATPDYAHLAAFPELAARRGCSLWTSQEPRRKATHIRTIRSTQGKLVLPLFTSMAELRAAMPKGKRGVRRRAP